MTETRKILRNAATDLDGVSRDAGTLLQNLNENVKPIVEKIQAVLVSAKTALDGANQALVSVNGFVGERSGTRHKLNRALEEIGAAAKSLKSLMDYLERHPNALLMGKGGSK